MDFDAIRDEVSSVLDATYRAREIGLTNCRKVIRLSANAIRSLHRGESLQAEELMSEAGELLRATVQVLAESPDILHAGFVHDAAKEYAEARLTAALGSGADVPGPAELGVAVPAFLNGLGEAAGEMRRRMLDLLRAGDLEGGERTLVAMDAVVELLASLDYPDGMTGGLRRTTDVARALAERSRSDLTTTMVQERLRADLRRLPG
jgi:translin